MGQEFKKVKMVAHRASQCLRARVRRCVCGSRSASVSVCLKSNKKKSGRQVQRSTDAVLLSARTLANLRRPKTAPPPET